MHTYQTEVPEGALLEAKALIKDAGATLLASTPIRAGFYLLTVQEGA